MVTAPEPQGCASGNYVCLDFEDTAPGAVPQGWGTDGTPPKVTDSAAHTGQHALRVSGRDYGSSGYITYPNVPSKHFGRLYYRFDEINAINYLHITLVEARSLISGAPARVVDTNLGGSDLNRMKYIFNIDDRGTEYNISSEEIFSYVQAQNRWVCVEWEVDPTTQSGALWEEGMLAYDAPLPRPDVNVLPATTFDSIAIGLRTYKGAQSSGWIDDVVIGPERIGCL